MTRQSSDALFDFWRARVAIAPGQRTLRYAFALRDGAAEREAYDNSDTVWAGRRPIKWFELTTASFPPFETPDWARDASSTRYSPIGSRMETRPTTARMSCRGDRLLPSRTGWAAIWLASLPFRVSAQTRHKRPLLQPDLSVSKQSRLRYDRLQADGLRNSALHEPEIHHGEGAPAWLARHPRRRFQPHRRGLRAFSEPHPRRCEIAVSPLVLREQFPVIVRNRGKELRRLEQLAVAAEAERQQPADPRLSARRGGGLEQGIDGWRLDAAPEVSHDFWKASGRRYNPSSRTPTFWAKSGRTPATGSRATRWTA